jgi:hypothetical protein
MENFPMNRKCLCASLLLAAVSQVDAGVLSVGSHLPVGVEWVRDEFNAGVGVRGGYAWEFAPTMSLEGAVAWANNDMAAVQDGPETNWKTYSVQAKFVHEIGRLGRFGFLYGAGAGWAVIDGKIDRTGVYLDPATTSPVEASQKILPFDHSSPFLVLDARVRAHFLEDRFFLELVPTEVFAGFDFRGFAPGIGVGWRF